MLFSTSEFIFGFLPVVLEVYLIVLHFGRGNSFIIFLLVSSLFFYGYWDATKKSAFDLWDLRYVALLLGSISFNFLIGRAIQAADTNRRLLLLFGVGIDLLLLAYFKYIAFFAANLNVLGLNIPINHVELPLGISFFTFTQIAFLCDAYGRKAVETNPWKYGLFVTYFPHLIAGPILHHKEMMSQFNRDLAKQNHTRNIAVGLSMFAFGLFKKVVIADSLSPVVGVVFDVARDGGTLTLWEAWLGAVAYTLLIFFVFCGYCEMALGLSCMFGIKLPANFNAPYQSRNIIEFWRRWHMTLSRFLRDYLYIALGGNRKGKVRRYVNLLTTMILGGLWHGAGWTFIIWGALHGTYLCMNHGWNALVGPRPSNPGRLRRISGQLLTFFAVLLGWVYFRSESVGAAHAVLCAMVGVNGVVMPMQLAGHFDGLGPFFGPVWPNIPPELEPSITSVWMIPVLTTALFAPSAMQIMKNTDITLDTNEYADSVVSWRPNLIWALFVALIFAVALIKIFLSASTEFLYFQF